MQKLVEEGITCKKCGAWLRWVPFEEKEEERGWILITYKCPFCGIVINKCRIHKIDRGY